MKAPKALISVVRQVNARERRAAAQVAEATYFAALKRLAAFGDFSSKTNEIMAIEAAVAEVLFRFR